jgi:hypothetical protein
MLKKIKLLNFIVILSVVLFVFGCAKTNRNIVTPQGVTQSITTTPSAVIPTPTATPLKITTTPPGVVVAVVPPIELKNLEKNALSVITDASARKWKDANKKYKTMTSELSVLTPKLMKAGVSVITINNITLSVKKLKTFITAKNSYETRLNSNDLVKYIADSMAVYKVTVPPDTIRLACYLRYIQYSLEKNNWPNAIKYGDLTTAMWNNLRVQIAKTNKNISTMDKRMSALSTAIKNKKKITTRNDVKKALTTTDSITKYFETKK